MPNIQDLLHGVKSNGVMLTLDLTARYPQITIQVDDFKTAAEQTVLFPKSAKKYLVF